MDSDSSDQYLDALRKRASKYDIAISHFMTPKRDNYGQEIEYVTREPEGWEYDCPTIEDVEKRLALYTFADEVR